MLKFAQKLTVSDQPQALPTFAELWQAADEVARYQLDERAAIYEYEAGFTRQAAETRAAVEFSRGQESEVRL